MSAFEEIRNLLGIYSEVMDAGDFEGLGALFEHGRMTDERGREIARGPRAITDLWNAMVRRYDGSPLTRHLVTGPIIHVEGDTATCRSSFLVAQKPPGGDLILVASGRYRDRFALIDGQWWFTERQFFLEQEGDLTQHMVDL